MAVSGAYVNNPPVLHLFCINMSLFTQTVFMKELAASKGGAGLLQEGFHI